MNVSPTPVEVAVAADLTAIYLRGALAADVRTDLSEWDNDTPVVHVHRVGGRRDRFRDRARIAIDVHALDLDTAFAVANSARAHLLAWPAVGGCSGTSEELGPVHLPITAELPTVVMTWVVTI